MIGLIFPGQGSQQIGMGKYLYDEYPEAKDLFNLASEILQMDMKKLCFDGPESELLKTENTQPALLLVSTVVQQILKKQNNLPLGATAGHSIGEYAALVAAGVLDFTIALKAVRLRGQEMQKAVPLGEGAMAAVMGLENHQVEFLCSWAEKTSGFFPLSPANFNCPGQIVISGSSPALSWLEKNMDVSVLPVGSSGAPPKKVRLIPLSVSAPFHCNLMKSAENKMREFLELVEFKNPNFPIIQNFNAKPVTDTQQLRENLIRQVSAPVLWMQSVECFKSLGISQFIECGSGKVLQGLLKKIDAEQLHVYTTNSKEEFTSILGTLFT